jgi:hypothetical protein
MSSWEGPCSPAVGMGCNNNNVQESGNNCVIMEQTIQFDLTVRRYYRPMFWLVMLIKLSLEMEENQRVITINSYFMFRNQPIIIHLLTILHFDRRKSAISTGLRVDSQYILPPQTWKTVSCTPSYARLLSCTPDIMRYCSTHLLQSAQLVLHKYVCLYTWVLGS